MREAAHLLYYCDLWSLFGLDKSNSFQEAENRQLRLLILRLQQVTYLQVTSQAWERLKNVNTFPKPTQDCRKTTALSSGIAVGGMVSGNKRVGQGTPVAPGFCSRMLSLWGLQLVKASVCHYLEDGSGAVSSCSFTLKQIQVLGKILLGAEKKILQYFPPARPTSWWFSQEGTFWQSQAVISKITVPGSESTSCNTTPVHSSKHI